MRRTTTRGTCKTCGGKGYLIRARQIERGQFVRADEICPVCLGDGNTPQPTAPASSEGATAMTRRKREMSSQAKAAAMIRKHLRQQYSHTKFSVRSDSFAGGDSVDITWTDGPTVGEVEQFTNQFQYGSFDGMHDLYELTNTRDDIPQAKYVHCQRSDSRDAYRAVVALLNAGRGWTLVVDEDAACNCIASGDHYTGSGWASHEVHREFHKLSCVCPDCKAPTLPGDAYCPECGTRQPVRCWMCEAMTKPRGLTDHHGHRICTACLLTELEHKYA